MEHLYSSAEDIVIIGKKKYMSTYFFRDRLLIITQFNEAQDYEKQKEVFFLTNLMDLLTNSYKQKNIYKSLRAISGT